MDWQTQSPGLRDAPRTRNRCTKGPGTATLSKAAWENRGNSQMFLEAEQIQLNRLEAVLRHPQAHCKTGDIIDLRDRMTIDAQVDTLEVGMTSVAGG